MSIPILTDGDLALRPPRESDVAERLSLGRSAEIARMFGGELSKIQPLTEGQVRDWYDWLKGQSHAWVIAIDDAFIGEIRLHEIDARDQRAALMVGIYDEGRLGKGIGRRAIRLVLAYAFNEMRLHRVRLRVIEYNVRAIACYQACGFREEGREREAALIDGERYDDVIMGVLAGEFGSISRRY